MKSIIRSSAVFAVVLGLLCMVSCGKKDPFAGKTYEGFMLIRSTLEFSTNNTVIVNLGVYEDEKGTYSYDSKAGTLVIDLEDRDSSLDFTYDTNKKILTLHDGDFRVDYKEEK